LEAVGCACDGRCSAADIGSHCGPRRALFRMQQANRLRPRHLHGGFANLDFSQRNISRDVPTSSRDVHVGSRPRSSTRTNTNINIKHTKGNAIEGGC